MRAITDLPTDALYQAGLGSEDIDAWSVSAPSQVESFEAAASALSSFLGRGDVLADRLPPPPRRADAERIAAEALAAALAAARISFLRAHADELYESLTDG